MTLLKSKLNDVCKYSKLQFLYIMSKKKKTKTKIITLIRKNLTIAKQLTSKGIFKKKYVSIVQ